MNKENCALKLVDEIILLFNGYYNTLYRETFIIFYNEPTNTQLIDKLSNSSYIFRHS